MPANRRLPILAAALMLALPALALPVLAQQGGKPVATIDGVPITEQDLAMAREDIGAAVPNMSDEQKRKYLTDYVIDLKMLARAAEQQKIGETPEFTRKIAYLRERALMETMMAREADAAVAGDKLQKFYDEAVKGLPPEEEAHARHILVKEEAEAKAVGERLKKGEDFAKVAGEISKDPGSGKEGGDLGWFTKDRMVPEFAEAAFALKPGEISAPVKSQFGWHVIKLEAKRTKPVPSLDDVKDELTRYMVQKGQQEMILKLRAQAKIERLEAADKPAVPAEPKK